MCVSLLQPLEEVTVNVTLGPGMAQLLLYTSSSDSQICEIFQVTKAENENHP